ncbi:MAG: hypothetical protein ACYC55_03055, partial [Candidatus Geothermincolia bacterium]
FVALIPIIGMFDGALSSVRLASTVHASAACAESVTEQVKATPFYAPYTGVDRDIDDRFWGNRSPANSNPEGASGPNWAAVPEVQLYGYGAMSDYPDMRATVQLSYLDDDTGVAAMGQFWGPKTAGNDLPKNLQGREIHIVLVRVNVRWMADGVESGHHHIDSIVTDTQATYNLGVSSISVTSPDSVKGTISNAGAHYPNVTMTVDIQGWGFDPATVTASLVRDTNNDIPITLVSKSAESLTGTMNIAMGGTSGSGHYWYPKADIGYWSVRIHQNDILSAYLYEGFIVEYPKPLVTDFYNMADSSKQAIDIGGTFSLRATGGRFVYQAENPAIRLVQNVAEGDPAVIEGTVTARAGANSGYADTGCTLDATFDPAGKPAGDYRLEVLNTRLDTVGHVSSGLSEAVFTLSAATPLVTDVVTDASSTHVAYNNQGDPWRLRYTGSGFNMAGSPPVDAYLCSAVTDGSPGGTQVQGTIFSVTGNNTILADFNLNGLATGFYYGLVRNANNGLTGWTATPLFEVRNLSAVITDFSPSAGSSFFENYYDIPSTITGTGLATAQSVKITNGTVTYDITSDSTLGGDLSIPVSLNLIACNHVDPWRVQVYFGGSAYVERAFTVTLGKAVILPANDSKHAIRIYARKGGSSAWRNETLAGRAWAWRTSWLLLIKTPGYGTFEVKGMGFPMGGSNTRLRVWKGSWEKAANYACTMDRAAKTVKITSAEWEMTDTTGDCGISVNATIGDTTVNSYSTRWYLSN